MTPHQGHWPQARLHVVTGKGGTGKTTVASALGLALAREGKRVLLCEVEGRQGLARLFDTDPLPYEERRLATGLGSAGGRGGTLSALHVDPEAALLEYLQMYYHLGRAGRLLDRFGVVEFATTLAPGVRDVLLTGKVFEAAERPRRTRGSVEYDAVVLDAPPTGRIAQFLGVNRELAGLAKVGPIRSQADAIMRMFRSPQTAVHLVTVLEEMPVQETADGIAELREAGLPVGGVVVNLTRPRVVDPDALAAAADADFPEAELAADLERSGLPARPGLVSALREEGREHAARQELEERQRSLVADLEVPTYELPRLPQGVEPGALYELAEMLRTQEMA